MDDSGKVEAVPAAYGSVTPYVAVKGADAMIDFVVRTFGAVVRGRVPNEDGTIGHAELMIGDSLIMLFDAKDDWPDTPGFLSVYVEDCDRTAHAALDAGATTITPMATSAWGDRGCRVRDPFGNIWWILSHVEDVPPDEIFRRMAEPSYLEVMRVAQSTFDEEMRQRGRPAAVALRG
jgi:uncharacterized glyoxalase superfamily protein PhnB